MSRLVLSASALLTLMVLCPSGQAHAASITLDCDKGSKVVSVQGGSCSTTPHQQVSCTGDNGGSAGASCHNGNADCSSTSGSGTCAPPAKAVLPPGTPPKHKYPRPPKHGTTYK